MSHFISKIIELWKYLNNTTVSEFFGRKKSTPDMENDTIQPDNDYEEDIVDDGCDYAVRGDFYDQDIENTPLNINNSITSNENEVASVRELYEYFIIPERKSVFTADEQSFIQYYTEKFTDVSEMKNYISGHNAVFLSNIGRHLDSYVKQMEKITGNLSGTLKDENENYIHEVFIKKAFDCISKHFISKTARQISGHISEEASQQYCIEFLEIFNRYLSDIGIYTYNACIQGSPMSDEDYNYYEVEAIYVSNSNLDGVVKKLECLPYLMNYIDYRGKTCSLCLSGQLTAYTADYS